MGVLLSIRRGSISYTQQRINTNPDREKLPEDLFDSYMSNEELIPSLDGKTVAITGTTSGLGFNIARCAITKNAALVLLLNRKSERSEKCEENLKKYLTEGSKTVIKTIDCDLMSFDSVKKAGGKTYVLYPCLLYGY